MRRGEPCRPLSGGRDRIARRLFLRTAGFSAAGFSVVDADGLSVSFFSDGFSDYFGINNGPGASDFGTGADDPPAGAPAYTGFDGGYLEAEDIDHDTGYNDRLNDTEHAPLLEEARLLLKSPPRGRYCFKGLPWVVVLCCLQVVNEHN